MAQDNVTAFPFLNTKKGKTFPSPANIQVADELPRPVRSTSRPLLRAQICGENTVCLLDEDGFATFTNAVRRQSNLPDGKIQFGTLVRVTLDPCGGDLRVKEMCMETAVMD